MNGAERRRLLAARREFLIARSAAQRAGLAVTAAPLALSWQRVEHLASVWRAVRRRPWLVALPIALLVAWRPRAALHMVASLPMAWRIGRAALGAARL